MLTDNFYTIAQLNTLKESGEITSKDIIDFYRARIEKFNGPINAVVEINHEKPLDSMYLPIGLKDNMAKKNLHMTCASKMLKDFVAPYDATVTEKMENNGAYVIGKLNCDEFAMGSSNEHSIFGPTSNPWNYRCVPGGSSGGSAAAVAAGLMPASLGSDTGGSVRQPAAFCGLVGLKPTYGTVSRFGIVAFASSLDQVGPITRTVEDNALVYNMISGKDERDATTVDAAIVNVDEMKSFNTFAGLKFAMPEQYISDSVDSDVLAGVEATCAYIRENGGEVDIISIPELKYVTQAYYVIAPSEASSNLARYDGIRYGHRSNNALNMDEIYTKSRREGFGSEVRRRLMIGTYVLSASNYEAYYMKASRLRRVLFEKFDGLFKEYAGIIGPTTPTTAYEIGELINDPIQMYLNDIYTIPANLTGLPNISIPIGFDKEGLPIGFQILGPRNSEQQLYNYSALIERELNCLDREPTLKEVK